MTQEIHQFQADESSRLAVEGLLIVFAAKLVNGLIGLRMKAVLGVGTGSFAGIGGVVVRLILFIGMIGSLIFRFRRFIGGRAVSIFFVSARLSPVIV